MTVPLILHSDCLPLLRTFGDNTIDSVVTDPPYGLTDHKPSVVVSAITAWVTGDRERVPDGKGFMGKKWDAFVPPPAVWDECFRTLKPGAHMAVFAGSRTAGLMDIAIRLAGFEIRDTVTWLYSNGFPKAKTVLKPASEPIIMARKPFKGSEISCIEVNGTGGLNINRCKILSADAPAGRLRHGGGSAISNSMAGPLNPDVRPAASAGRWPANVVFTHASTPDGHDACAEGCVDGCPVATLDAQIVGTRAAKPSGTRIRHSTTSIGDGNLYNGGGPIQTESHEGTGAARFYNVFRYQAKAPKSERPVVDGKAHPTVKPLALMRWLVKLITPPGGVVLDPFAGSGTTGQAAQMEGFESVLMEKDAESMPFIYQRFGLGEWVRRQR